RHRGARLGGRARSRRRQVPRHASRRVAAADPGGDLQRDTVARGIQSRHRNDHGPRGDAADLVSPAAIAGGIGRYFVRKLAFLVLAACLSVTAAAAQEPSKLEADAKKAFDTGKFKEAGDKYARAAESADVPDDRKADVHLQSAWSYYIAGSSKAAREQLKSALTLRPDLKVIPDFYSPDFANLASAVRAEVSGANVPAVDVEEVKRGARAKLEDGKTEEALYDLKRAEAANDPEVFRIEAEAAD